MRALSTIVEPSASLMFVRVADDLHRRTVGSQLDGLYVILTQLCQYLVFIWRRRC